MYAENGAVEDTFGDENPLKDSASLEVYLKEVSNQKKLVASIKKLEGVRKVNSSSTIAQSLTSFNALITYISFTVIILLVMVSVFLISTAVATGIRVRRDEISIMKYIGATNMFVKLPFLVEGIVIGLVGAALPLLLLWFLYERLIRFIIDHFSVLAQWLTFVPTSREFQTLIPMSLIVGVGIGFLGSAVSVRKHLKE